MEYSEIQSKSKEELIKIAEELNLLKDGNSQKKSELIYFSSRRRRKF